MKFGIPALLLFTCTAVLANDLTITPVSAGHPQGKITGDWLIEVIAQFNNSSLDTYNLDFNKIWLYVKDKPGMKTRVSASAVGFPGIVDSMTGSSAEPSGKTVKTEKGSIIELSNEYTIRFKGGYLSFAKGAYNYHALLDYQKGESSSKQCTYLFPHFVIKDSGAVASSNFEVIKKSNGHVFLRIKRSPVNIGFLFKVKSMGGAQAVLNKKIGLMVGDVSVKITEK
jgi:hypothetical protein